MKTEYKLLYQYQRTTKNILLYRNNFTIMICLPILINKKCGRQE